MVSRIIICSSVMPWVFTRHGIRGRQQGKIHYPGPHPLECGLFSGYIDNPTLTPYRPQETFMWREGESYGGTTPRTKTPGIPATQPLGLFQCPEPRLGGGLSRPPVCPPLCARDTGSDHPGAQKLRRLDVRRAAAHALSGPGPDHPW